MAPHHTISPVAIVHACPSFFVPESRCILCLIHAGCGRLVKEALNVLPPLLESRLAARSRARSQLSEIQERDPWTCFVQVRNALVR